MELYQSKKKIIPGKNYKEVLKISLVIYKTVTARTKRSPYLRSKYFRKQKIFLGLFWSHLYEKYEKDRVRRLRYFECALDLIRYSTFPPTSVENNKNRNEILHRFYGSAKTGEKFIVQIKENKKTNRKDLISIYPDK